MRLFTSRCLTILLSLFISLAGFAQADYSVKLQSGNYIPVENIKGLSQGSPVFTQSRFQHTYYVAIQFRKLPTDKERAFLTSNQILLLDYLPANTYLAAVAVAADINTLQNVGARAVFRLEAFQKTAPALLRGAFPAHAVKTSGTVDLTVSTYEKFSTEDIAAALRAAGAEILDAAPMFNNVTVRIAQDKFKSLLELPFIVWAEAIDAPNKAENLLGRTLHRVNVLNDGVRNLKGNGINVGIWDESAVDGHLDFTPVAGRLFIQEPGTPSSHSTHCGGTIAGGGLINPKARGMAPRSKLYSWNFNGNIQAEMASAIPTFGLSVSSHSYGSTQTCGITGAGVAYSTTSRNTDINLNDFPNHLHVHSAGNSQTACAGGWSTITGSGKTAKNNILVANIGSTEAINGTSSFGPIADGRVKPEISSFGTNVLSTYPNNQYGTISGTSMATPGVAGSVALLVERYRQLNANTEPPSALIKNTILNTAQDLGTAGPDYKFGFGRLNALAAVRILEQNRYRINSISTGASNDVSINVPAGAAKLRVMITWNDPAALPNAVPALVNDLDLAVINGATTTLPWKLDPLNPADPAVRGVDNVSNIEQVTIDNPPAGSYTLRVSGASVAFGPQQYSLTWSIEQPFVEVIFPNGGESLSPGASETITWDNAGITSPQTVEYSVDNGASWTVISSTVSPNTTRLSWTVPAANTSTALVRVSNGALTDVSDASFKILGIPGTPVQGSSTCNAGELSFNWTAVPNATHYDLLRLDQSTGEYVVAGADITGTTFTVTGLVPSSMYWFALQAKNNTTGAVSDRSLAAGFMASATGFGTIGNISGNTVICSAAANVAYSVAAVPGAVNYTWTVPAGANIVSGQGTSSITVTYPGSAITGNITVQASSGTCQTNVASIAITSTIPVANITASGPLVFCQGGNVVLTASSGTGYLWSNGATTQTITVTTAGSYSVTVNNGSGCSNTSAPTVVSVTALPTVNLSASPYTRLFPGLSTTLTANATNATTYTWYKNGALLPSVTGASLPVGINDLGDYSVTVTAAGGCSNNSAVVSVSDSAVKKLFISPNPNNGVFQVNYHNDPGASLVLTIYDGKGARVYNQAYQLTSAYQPMYVNLRRNTAGVYRVLLSDRGGKKLATGSVVLNR